MSNIKVFEDRKIRTQWNEQEEDWYFSLVDVVAVLADTENPTDYLKKMRKRDSELGTYIGTNCPQVEMEGFTGKKRKVLAGNTKDVFRLIQSIPSKKAEPFKVWLAQVGSERLDEIADPQKAIDRVEAMDRCIGLGKKFIEHFDKIYNAKDNSNKKHWAREMSGWLKSVRQIKLKNTNDFILDGDLRDWFFTAGANPQDFMKSPTNEQLKVYDIFTNKLVNNQDVYSALKNIKLIDSLIKDE